MRQDQVILANLCGRGDKDIFTVAEMIVPILWDIASGSEADYERSFWYALAFGSAYGVSSLLFKSKLVVLR
jgi:hypothetical protein